MNRIARLEFDSQILKLQGLPVKLLSDILEKLPPGTEFLGVTQEFNITDTFNLLFKSNHFREVAESERIPVIQAWIKRDYHGLISVEKVDLSETLSQNGPTSVTHRGCVPTYKEYFGLNERYNYCVHCGKKESEHS